jgi:hypothetical protein
MKCPNATKLHRKSGPLLLSPLFHEDGQILIFPAPPAEQLWIRELATVPQLYRVHFGAIRLAIFA